MCKIVPGSPCRFPKVIRFLLWVMSGYKMFFRFQELCNLMRKCLFFFSAGKSPAILKALSFLLGMVLLAGAAHAVPTSKPVITEEGKRCVKIATAGVDHGEDVAQKYADDLLKSDIEAFKKSKKLKSVRISNRFRKCRFHLWFFGNEYNCTSAAKVCW